MFPALLDTCVLWPSRQRDFLLSLAVVNLYRPLWSSAILDELRCHEIEKLIERHGFARPRAEARAAHLVEQMDEFLATLRDRYGMAEAVDLVDEVR